jgi:type I restriction enzyme M protein
MLPAKFAVKKMRQNLRITFCRFVFIKRLSDVFEDEVARLTETYNDKQTAFQVLEADHSLVRFYIPPQARWPVVSGREQFDWPQDQKSKTLGEQLTTTVRTIVKANPSLGGAKRLNGSFS